jgi:hypothetical protein
MRRMELTVVVLPTPGPPVMTSRFDTRASLRAALWLSASAMPVRCSIQGNTFSGSIHGQGSLSFKSVSSRSAMTSQSAERREAGRLMKSSNRAAAHPK